MLEDCMDYNTLTRLDGITIHTWGRRCDYSTRVWDKAGTIHFTSTTRTLRRAIKEHEYATIKVIEAMQHVDYETPFRIEVSDI